MPWIAIDTETRGEGGEGEWINDTGHGVETKHRLREL